MEEGREDGKKIAREEKEESAGEQVKGKGPGGILKTKKSSWLWFMVQSDDMSSRSNSKNNQKSKTDLFNMREIHNAYCIIPLALCQFSYLDVTGCNNVP